MSWIFTFLKAVETHVHKGQCPQELIYLVREGGKEVEKKRKENTSNGAQILISRSINYMKALIIYFSTRISNYLLLI